MTPTAAKPPLLLFPLIPMPVPKAVQHWLDLRKEYERQLEINPDPPMPRVLPVVKIGRKWYFADERLREYRRIDHPEDRIGF